MKFATGKDDPALAETAWPMPPADDAERDVEWLLRYGAPTRSDMLAAAEVFSAYLALIADGTTARQTKRLAALRRVHRRRTR